jgi:hypothetical protein
MPQYEIAIFALEVETSLCIFDVRSLPLRNSMTFSSNPDQTFDPSAKDRRRQVIRIIERDGSIHEGLSHGPPWVADGSQPRDRETIQIKAGKKVDFRSAKELKEVILGGNYLTRRCQ